MSAYRRIRRVWTPTLEGHRAPGCQLRAVTARPVRIAVEEGGALGGIVDGDGEAAPAAAVDEDRLALAQDHSDRAVDVGSDAQPDSAELPERVHLDQIGRASCRERVESAAGAATGPRTRRVPAVDAARSEER